MAVNPKWTLRSPGYLADSDGSNELTLITGRGAPDGDSEPCRSAAKGSLYLCSDAADDKVSIYLKSEDDKADDDWVQLIAAECTDEHTIGGTWTWYQGNGIELRDSDVLIYSPSVGVGAIALAAGTVFRIGNLGDGNYVEIDSDGRLGLAGGAGINPGGSVSIFDDFLYQEITEKDTPWILNSGSDDLAVDPAIDVQAGGVIQLVTGDDDGSTAVDASQLVCAIPVQAGYGGLVVEAKLRIVDAVTNVAVNFGLTDATTLEEPFTIGALDAITSNTTDGACFVYDTDAATDEWFACAVADDGDDGDCGTTGEVPVADTFQVLRIEVDDDGSEVRFYIDGVLEATLDDGGVSDDVDLYATVIACGDGTASKAVDVDYLYVGHARS
jgi:hypothetical protein